MPGAGCPEKSEPFAIAAVFQDFSVFSFPVGENVLISPGFFRRREWNFQEEKDNSLELQERLIKRQPPDLKSGGRKKELR